MPEKNKKTVPKKPTLKDQIKSLNNDIESEKDKYLRLFAEFENFRKRTSKERIELFKTASKELMSALLPVLDDMDRALKEFEKDNNVDYTIVNNRMDRNKFSPSPGVDMTADGKFVIHPPLKYFNKD